MNNSIFYSTTIAIITSDSVFFITTTILWLNLLHCNPSASNSYTRYLKVYSSCFFRCMLWNGNNWTMYRESEYKHKSSFALAKMQQLFQMLFDITMLRAGHGFVQNIMLACCWRSSLQTMLKLCASGFKLPLNLFKPI